MAGAIIECNGVTKLFGDFAALNNVSLDVSPGTIGLLGPNGAGKSTLMKCLLQLQPISMGVAKLLGRDVGSEGREIRTRVGYAPEQDCLISGMVGCEYVTYCAQLNGLPFQEARQRAHEMLDFVGMGQERYRPVDTYSTGMKQRVKLAQAIVHDPEMVFLDEPTNGLDPKGREQILQLVESLWKKHNISVVLSSHLLQDVDRICGEIIIIARGEVLVKDTLKNLKGRRAGFAELVVEGEHQRVLEILRANECTCELESNGHITVEHGRESLTPVLRFLRDAGVRPIEALPSPNALEEVFLQALSTHGPD